MTNIEIMHASEMNDLCVQILERREPGTLKAYKRALAKYERGCVAAGSKQVWRKDAGLFGQKKRVGYYVLDDIGAPQFIERPSKPSPLAYMRSRYMRFSDGASSPAKDVGLLADSRFNRDIREERITQYAEEMKAGRWRDLLSDPITITADGQVLNGQHRIAAATQVGWTDVDNDPQFLVVWDVDPSEAQYADGSRRTDRDQKVIGGKLLDELAAA